MKNLYVSEHFSDGPNGRTGELREFFDKACRFSPLISAVRERDPFPDDARIKAICFDGLSFDGVRNEVFAYIGFPGNASAEHPVPGIVLAHGGGGHAYAEWVQYWADHGFAAISFDGFGQTYIGEDHTYEASLDFWKASPTAHLPPEFISPDKPVSQQGFAYFVADIMLAYSILENDVRVKADMIGATGISWGGYGLSIAVCYDSRFAFAAPVYGCGFMDASNTPWGEPFRADGITETWDAKHLFGEVSVPTHFFNSDRDPFFDANASTASAAAVKNGALTLIPEFTHGQIEGSAIPELLRFAEEEAGRGQRNIKITALSAEKDGARISYSLPDGVGSASVCVYYKNEDLIYNEKYLVEPWRCEKTAAAGATARIGVPDSARLFYFCVKGVSDAEPGSTLHASSGVFTRELWNEKKR